MCFGGRGQNAFLRPPSFSNVFVSSQGENLNFAAEMHEFQVTIGTGVCLVESLNEDKLYCVPPEDQPAAANGAYASLPMVKVRLH